MTLLVSHDLHIKYSPDDEGKVGFVFVVVLTMFVAILGYICVISFHFSSQKDHSNSVNSSKSSRGKMPCFDIYCPYLVLAVLNIEETAFIAAHCQHLHK